ncbi:MAG: dTMP kinase [Trueperaceae bacterium]
MNSRREEGGGKREKKAQSYFIVFEGPEGAGKSTQINHLVSKLRETFDVVQTREPGGTPAADAIRKVLLDPALTISPLTEVLLYSASRAQHVEEVIKPALENNKVVVCDRFFGTSIAYQGYGRGLELEFIYTLTEKATQGITPDLVLLLDIDPQIGMERIAQRGQKDRLELADISFHHKVREGFLAQAKENKNWVIINAQQDEATVEAEIWQTVQEHLGVG